MHDNHSPSFFARHQRSLFIFSAIYVVGLVLSHSTLPEAHVWAIAAFFSIAMNFTYFIEAIQQPKHRGKEAVIAGSLILLSVLGALWAPLAVVFAIFAHGFWDVAKHRGHGVPFFTWYTLGCATVDWIYGAALLVYWMNV